MHAHAHLKHHPLARTAAIYTYNASALSTTGVIEYRANNSEAPEAFMSIYCYGNNRITAGSVSRVDLP